MYEIRKNVLVNDFSENTKEFLLKIGFEENDNISEIFQKVILSSPDSRVLLDFEEEISKNETARQQDKRNGKKPF